MKISIGVLVCSAVLVAWSQAPAPSTAKPEAERHLKNIKQLTHGGENAEAYFSPDGSHPVQKAWADVDVVQCGYCQPGQIMSAAALIAHNPSPSDEDIDAALAGNICRCGTYQRVREAVRKAAAQRRASR